MKMVRSDIYSEERGGGGQRDTEGEGELER